jgi:hypothetical protein
MKGVVFTELMEFVEDNMGFDVADEVIKKADLANGGAFTQGGNYPFEELLKMVIALSEVSGKSIPELLEIFGEHLFYKLVKIYDKDIKEKNGALSFIDSIEEIVHVEVKKLYPDADLPTFETESKTDAELTLVYSSEKQLEAFAKGLMIGCSKFFNEPLDIEYETISESPHKVRFKIRKI